jgi:hypothetical protein
LNDIDCQLWAAERPWRHRGDATFVASALDFDRATGLEIYSARPCGLGEWFRKDQLPGGAIDDVEEPILWCVEDRLSRLASDREIREHDVHVRVEVPRLARRRLVMPAIVTRIGIERDDGAEEQIVAAAGTADLANCRPIVRMHFLSSK